MRLIFLSATVLLALSVVGCSGSDSGGSTPTGPSANVPFSTVDVRVGTGAEANTGRTVSVNYAGYLYSATATDNKGTPFDSGPFTLTIGVTNVIQGFSQGLIGMRAGGLRRVIIPPSLGYGAAGSPPRIPGNATLVFDLELVAVQ